MGKDRTWMALGLAAAVLALWPAAAAAAQDQSSDHAALTAYHSYLAGVTARLPDARKADAAYVSSVSGRCPNVLASLKQAPAGSVNQTALFDFGEELGGDTGVVAYGPARAELAKMAGTLRKLRWSSPQATKTVKRYLTAQGQAVQPRPERSVRRRAGARGLARGVDPGGDVAMAREVRARRVGAAVGGRIVRHVAQDSSRRRRTRASPPPTAGCSSTCREASRAS